MDEGMGRIDAEAEVGTCRLRPTEPNQSANEPPLLEKPPTMDDFILVKPISKGAFGKVWLGYKRTNSNRMLAIKVMKKLDLVKKNLMSQVVAERDAQAMSRSPFVVQLYYSIQSTHNIFLVMEYMIGGDVKSLLIMYGFFNEDMACLYAAEVTLALEYLHTRGIVHRDLKPDNMLISDRGHIKLTDFGLSKVGIDGKASPQPCMMNQLELRTPGQILSLKSSLVFTIPRSHRKFVQTAGKQDSEIPSPLPPPPKTPKDKATNRRFFTRKMLTPQPTSKLPSQASRVKHNSVGSTPPVKSLTPTLQDSLTWRNSTASDSNSRQACSLLQSSIDNRKKDSPAVCSSAPVKTDVPLCTGQKTDIGLNTANSCPSQRDLCDSSVFSEDHNELVQTRAKSVLDPASCDSHVMPLIPWQVEGGDNDTPLLHRTHSSVWNSYAAQRLRSMRDGSYCSDEYPKGNSAPVSDTNSVSREDSDNLHRKDTHTQISCVGSNEKGEKQIEGISQDKKKVDESKEFVNNSNAENILSVSDMSKVSDFSVEKARGILSSCDQSFGRTNIFTKSYTSSMATSIDLEMSSDFSNHFSKKDQFFNSTRISLEFGHNNISLDSGPELKDLSELPSLNQVPLRVMTESSLNALTKHDKKSKFSRNASDKDVDSVRKSNRRLKKPGLRRVLSDTFDKCIHDESPYINGSHQIIKNHKAGAHSQGVSSAPSMRYAGKKRIYADTNVSSESDKSPDISLNAHSGLTPDVSRININEGSSQKPLKVPRLDRKHYSQNLFQPKSSGYTHPTDLTNDNISKMQNQPNNLARQYARNTQGFSSTGLLDTSQSKQTSLDRGSKSTGLTCDIDRLRLEHLFHNQTISIGITPSAEPHHTGFIQSDTQTNSSELKNFVGSNSNVKDNNSEDYNSTQCSLAPVLSTAKTNDDFDSEKISAISPVHLPQGMSEDLNCQHNVSRNCELKDIHFLPPSSIPPISPGSLLFSSLTPGTQPPDPSLPQEESTAHHSPFYKPLIMLKGISTLNSSIESDGCHNTTIEMETNTSLNQVENKSHAINRSRNSSSSSMSDTNMADHGDGVLQNVGKQSPPFPNPVSQAQKNHTEPNTDESPEDHNFTKPQSTYKEKLGAGTKALKSTRGEEEQDKISPLMDRKLSVMTAATPHPLIPLTEAAFQTPLNTPALRLRTPLRTPKSVRRGPDIHESERILGTPDYLAPEMLVHNQHGFEVDWWALGVCLYEFLTGIPPFNDVTPEAVFENILNRNIIWPEGDESISIEARDAIEALLTFDPEKRPKAKDVKCSAFFSSLDWDNILNMEPPFVPNPDDEMDTTYFERM